MGNAGVTDTSCVTAVKVRAIWRLTPLRLQYYSLEGTNFLGGFL